MKNNKGFTLIESVITFAILAIAGLMLMSLTSNVIHLMKESAFIKNETDQKYAYVQIGDQVEKKDMHIELVLADDGENIVQTIQNQRTKKETGDQFNFQLSKMVADSAWIDEAPNVPPVEPDELLDATFVILKDIRKYTLEDGEGQIILKPEDYLSPDPEGIFVRESLKKSYGEKFTTILSNPNLPSYLVNKPTFNDFNNKIDSNTNLSYLDAALERIYLATLRKEYEIQLANNIPIPIDWVAIDNRNPENPIVYGILVPTIPPVNPDKPDEKPEDPGTGDVIISIDDGQDDIVFDKNHTKISSRINGGTSYQIYIDGKLVGTYKGSLLTGNGFTDVINGFLTMDEYKNAKLISIVDIGKNK